MATGRHDLSHLPICTQIWFPALCLHSHSNPAKYTHTPSNPAPPQHSHRSSLQSGSSHKAWKQSVVTTGHLAWSSKSLHAKPVFFFSAFVTPSSFRNIPLLLFSGLLHLDFQALSPPLHPLLI
ncbi:unnamed protein product [Protopolystoma xenopodis]|uniref:Uncharacterized protein n=1 Tax=Protopolystoma xenopodis TaxID=117903 RepID=A0A3S5A525_9PLAT|nr:unnamed protein product [Protopolystoma xenopodis]